MLRNLGYAHIDLRDLIPCLIVCDSSGREVEDLLKFLYRIRCVLTVDAINGHCADGRVIQCYAGELALEALARRSSNSK